MPSHFFALLSRMKYIPRWALMRNAAPENLSEHSLETAILAHALTVLHNTRCGGKLSPERAATLALFHDAPEVLTGDLPTPVKYHSEQLRAAYQQVEDSACARLLGMLPEDLRGAYAPLLSHRGGGDALLLRYVKAADKLSALIKCMEERKAGNLEFCCAEAAARRALEEMRLPAVEYFLAEFLPAYEQPLDQLTN
ncbi:MAG: 5'-deoxynucleotidase [Oscillospiraceae bacterium]|jgi:5'-deoxynucleotidase|nr:5'-deoxynucleotidase [Oscillospiraceae bacterium]